MILPDSSVWIDHLQRPVTLLSELLMQRMIVGHPFITGEVSLGSIASRDRVIDKLGRLRQMPVVEHERVALLIANFELWGKGIGYVDAHLLATVRMAGDIRLWSRDKRLHVQAEKLGLAFAE